MNNRIKQLAIQAGVYVGDDMWFADELNTKTQMFAQLVVRECASISNQAEKQCQHPGTQIMKHFGVEE
jgi:hypothetical protein